MFTSSLAFADILPVALRLLPLILLLSPEVVPRPVVVRLKLPATSKLDPTLVVLSTIECPPFLAFPQVVSVLFRSSRVEMLISPPAVILRLPEDVLLFPESFLLALICAARFSKSFLALMATAPPSITAVLAILLKTSIPPL
jgi:hypothetical protein